MRQNDFLYFCGSCDTSFLTLQIATTPTVSDLIKDLETVQYIIPWILLLSSLLRNSLLCHHYWEIELIPTHIASGYKHSCCSMPLLNFYKFVCLCVYEDRAKTPK